MVSKQQVKQQVGTSKLLPWLKRWVYQRYVALFLFRPISRSHIYMDMHARTCTYKHTHSLIQRRLPPSSRSHGLTLHVCACVCMCVHVCGSRGWIRCCWPCIQAVSTLLLLAVVRAMLTLLHCSKCLVCVCLSLAPSIHISLPPSFHAHCSVAEVSLCLSL